MMIIHDDYSETVFDTQTEVYQEPILSEAEQKFWREQESNYWFISALMQWGSFWESPLGNESVDRERTGHWRDPDFWNGVGNWHLTARAKKQREETNHE